MHNFDYLLPEIRELIVANVDDIYILRHVSKEINHMCRFRFAHKMSRITQREMLEYALQPEQEFALDVGGDIIYFDKTGYATHGRGFDGDIKKYPTGKVVLHTLMNKHYNTYIDINNNRIKNDIRSPIRSNLNVDIDLLSKGIILRNKGYDELIHDYTKTYTMHHLKCYMPGMYSTRMRYSNYLKLLASARIYGICMDKEEYTKDEITVNNHDRTLYKMLEILLKV